MNILIEKNNCLVRRFDFGEIVSKSPFMEKIYKILPVVAKSRSNVMILGEPGTGKEMIAKAIHYLGPRKDKPFAAVNCGAIPETFMEPELFGCKAGSCTGTTGDMPGRLASAEGGSLFLNEIGGMPLPLQRKLLRVIQEKEYEVVGSSCPVRADVRIMAATSCDLEAMTRENTFRKDLFYRLNVIVITLPPLRQRREDIPMLTGHFIRKYNALQKKAVSGVSGSALDVLMQYHYPGNIRELENIIEHAFIFGRNGYIEPGHLPELYEAGSAGGELQAITPQQAVSIKRIEKNVVRQALNRNNWRKLATCRELGISKDALRRKIKSYRLVNPFDEPHPNSA